MSYETDHIWNGSAAVSDESEANTDRELWRAVSEDYYAPSVFVTIKGGIGMNHGGTVFVMTVKEWIELAKAHPPVQETMDSQTKGNQQTQQL